MLISGGRWCLTAKWLISRLDRHQSATSAFMLKCKFLTWEKRWRASAEQLSCLGSSIIGDAWVEGGGSSGGESWSVTCSVESLVALMPSIESVRSNFACGRNKHIQRHGCGRINNDKWWSLTKRHIMLCHKRHFYYLLSMVIRAVLLGAMRFAYCII